jgi:predicted membrane-bound mannosyltransferase
LSLLLFAQAMRYNGSASSDPSNPYVYAHTLPDVYRIRDRVEEVALRHPSGTGLPVDIFSADNWWPLPWYLRQYPNVRWWRGDTGKVVPGPLVLLSPAAEDAVARALYQNRPPGERELYGSLFEGTVWLRPGVEVRGYAALSIMPP